MREGKTREGGNEGRSGEEVVKSTGLEILLGGGAT